MPAAGFELIASPFGMLPLDVVDCAPQRSCNVVNTWQAWAGVCSDSPGTATMGVVVVDGLGTVVECPVGEPAVDGDVPPVPPGMPGAGSVVVVSGRVGPEVAVCVPLMVGVDPLLAKMAIPRATSPMPADTYNTVRLAVDPVPPDPAGVLASSRGGPARSTSAPDSASERPDPRRHFMPAER